MCITAVKAIALLIDGENDKIIVQYATMSDAIIIAWGSLGNTSECVRERQTEIFKRLSNFRNKLYKIGEQGYHPLTPTVRNQ